MLSCAIVRRLRALALSLVVLAAWPASATAQRVRQIIDGDTITVSGVGVVRLLGVDAPEKTGGYRESEPFGDAAAAFMKRLLEGQDVRLEYDGARKDQYNRTLAYVFLPDGRLANLEIIKAGYAETYRRFEYQRKPSYFAAEREAKEARRGMWATRRARDERMIRLQGWNRGCYSPGLPVASRLPPCATSERSAAPRAASTHLGP